MFADITSMRLKAILSIAIAVILTISNVTTAYAFTGFSPNWKVSNGTVTVGAKDDGSMAYTTDGTNWTSVDVGMSKNGIRSLNYIPAKKMFIATSFFDVATSTDGKTWRSSFLPVGEKFNPADIISDAEFFGGTSMSVDNIQAFLNSKIDYCTPGYTCLNRFSEQTWSRDATVLCKAYSSEGVESAAKIIWKVSQACGVKAEVLLVTLQKENSLVTRSAPTAGSYKTAMGYACPDTAACDSEYFGFYNQVYNAAKQFKRYANPAGTSLYFTWYPVGRTSNLRWSPDATCGASPVVIANQATSGLYYYTPYQPNDAALKNIQGLGDSCSAYGNRNFWRTYNVWFNTDKDYKTFTASNGSTIIAVDDNGTAAFSTDGINWTKFNPMSISGNITSLEYDASNGKYHAVSSSGKHYYSPSGETWTESATALPTTGNPAPAPSNPVNLERTVSSGGVNRRTGAATTYSIAASMLPEGSTVTINGWITGQSVDGINVWYRLVDGYYSWAGGFTSQSVEGVTNLNPGATPTPTPTPTPTLTPTPTPTPAPTVTPKPVPAGYTLQPNYYTVKAGDTLAKLATWYKATVADLAKWNKITTSTVLTVNQKLIVGYKLVANTPTPTPTPTVTAKYYTVVSGDTMWAISLKFNVSLVTLGILNPTITDLSKISVGQKIRYQ